MAMALMSYIEMVLHAAGGLTAGICYQLYKTFLCLQPMPTSMSISLHASSLITSAKTSQE